MELTYEDSGKERSASVGERFEIELPESPTTGYRWQVVELPPELRQIGDENDVPEEPRGAGGRRILEFEVISPGHVTLALEKRRAWEHDATDRFTLQLRLTSAD